MKNDFFSISQYCPSNAVSMELIWVKMQLIWGQFIDDTAQSIEDFRVPFKSRF